MKALCVYCGSSRGASPIYEQTALALAGALARENIALVYGGGNVGLMGILADEVMRQGGEVTGVIPKALLDKEIGHLGLTRLHIVKDMHERKAMMASLSDGFIALPGGLGTLEELFEALTWAQLGFHEKPIGLLNVAGFYDGLIAFVQKQVQEGFVRPGHAGLMLHEAGPDALLERFKSWTPSHEVKWLDRPAAEKLLP